MSNKELKTRIQLKNDTAENWKTASDNGFIPKLGEPIFYREQDGEGSKFSMKIGDGVRSPDGLPIYTQPISTLEIDEICYGVSRILNDNSWAKIREISDMGIAQNLWSIGDCKSVNLSGTMGTLTLDTTLWVYILGFDHNAEKEGYGIHFGGFKTDSGDSGVNVCLIDSKHNGTSSDGTKYFNMQHWGSANYGGWARCDMRYDILGSTDVAPQSYGTKAASGQVGYAPSETCATNPVENTLMSCLPEDLRIVMKPITKYTDNVGGTNAETNVSAMVDYLPLLAEFEIFGSRENANSYEQNNQAQYEYFAAGNSKIMYSHSSTIASAQWWERSPRYGYSNLFCSVTSNGSTGNGYAEYSRGVAPVFMV